MGESAVYNVHAESIESPSGYIVLQVLLKFKQIIQSTDEFAKENAKPAVD